MIIAYLNLMLIYKERMIDMSVINGVIIQFFHWYTPDDGSLWDTLSREAKNLSQAGFTAIWLPPAYKGVGGGMDVGYGVYDLFDLGEFDQKGSIRTKYGTKEAYIKAIDACHEHDLQVYADLVFNHKMGADREEELEARPYSHDDRHKPIGEMQKIRAWTNFTFPGRDDMYSSLKWHWWHFNAVDYNALNEKTDAVYLFKDKSFDEQVDEEKGNFDYLMGCNLDMNNQDVIEELIHWGKWYIDTTGVDGFRFDAVKHVKADFFRHWLHQMQLHASKELFAVGEYWSGDRVSQDRFIENTQEKLMLFDVNLHYNFSDASVKGKEYDLRQIFDNTLIKDRPNLAVTFVSNHDSQPLQALESVVEHWFTPIAYAITLLRRDGYPCVFTADYYGATYADADYKGEIHNIELPSHKWLIDKFLHARRHYAYGNQIDYFEHPNCIGWARTGDRDHPCVMVVVISNGDEGSLFVKTGTKNTSFIDLTEHISESVKTNENGEGTFPCPGRSMSVWIAKC